MKYLLDLGKAVLYAQLLCLGYKLHSGYLKDRPSPDPPPISALNVLALDDSASW